MAASRGWFNKQMRESIKRLLERPSSRRGPYIITDEQLRNAKRALTDGEQHDDR